MVTKAFIDFSKVEAGFKAWQKADAAWQARAARGPGVRGRARGHPDGVLLRLGRASTRSAAPGAARSRRPRSARSGRRRPSLVRLDARVGVPVDRARSPRRPPRRRRRQARQDARSPERPGRRGLRAGRSSRRRPPSPRSPARKLFTSGWLAACSADGVAQRARAEAVDDQDLLQPGQRRRRRGSAPGPRAPRRRGRRGGRATRRRCGPARAAGSRSRSRVRDGIPPRAAALTAADSVGRSPAVHDADDELQVVDARPRPASRRPRASPACRPSRGPRSGPPSRRSGSGRARPGATCAGPAARRAGVRAAPPGGAPGSARRGRGRRRWPAPSRSRARGGGGRPPRRP